MKIELLQNFKCFFTQTWTVNVCTEESYSLRRQRKWKRSISQKRTRYTWFQNFIFWKMFRIKISLEARLKIIGKNSGTNNTPVRSGWERCGKSDKRLIWGLFLLKGKTIHSSKYLFYIHLSSHFTLLSNTALMSLTSVVLSYGRKSASGQTLTTYHGNSVPTSILSLQCPTTPTVKHFCLTVSAPGYFCTLPPLSFLAASSVATSALYITYPYNCGQWR